MSPARSRARRRFTLLAAAVLVTAVAASPFAALSAFAQSTAPDTIGVAKSVKITATSTRAAVAVNSKGVAVYELIPETTHHLLCTQANGCENFWPPVTVKSAQTKLIRAIGLKGRLGVLHRQGLFQVTLGDHPLYTFAADKGKPGIANGEGLRSFHGVWHVIRSSSGGGRAPSGSTHTTPTTTTTPPTTTTPYPGY